MSLSLSAKRGKHGESMENGVLRKNCNLHEKIWRKAIHTAAVCKFGGGSISIGISVGIGIVIGISIGIGKSYVQVCHSSAQPFIIVQLEAQA